MLCAVRVFDPSPTVALAQARGSVQVGAGGNLQAALDSAVAGDIIELPAGAIQRSGTVAGDTLVIRSLDRSASA